MCSIEYCDDYCQVLALTTRKARKAHRCRECGRVVEKGEAYLDERLYFDRLVSTHRTCAHCQAIRNWLKKQCGGWVYHNVAEDFLEHAGEQVWPYAIKRAMVGLKNRWATRKGELMRVPTI